MNLDELLSQRLHALADTPSPLGNVLFAENPSLDQVQCIWDIPFATGTEAVLFQKIYLTIIASLFFDHTSISSQVDGLDILVNVKDGDGYFKLVESHLWSYGNHYKGQIIMNLLVRPTKLEGFLDQCKTMIYKTLEEINEENLKI